MNDSIVILSCGHSMNDLSDDEINKLCEDRVVFCVKQAIHRYPKCHFHFWNCSNLPLIGPENKKYHYDYSNHMPIVIGSSNFNLAQRISPFQYYDVFYTIPGYRNIEKDTVAGSRNFEAFTLDNSFFRPCGPGIMYETVIYYAYTLKPKEIICVGWDLSYDWNNNETHFYNTEVDIKGSQNQNEIDITIQSSSDLYYWLRSNGIQLKLLSTRSKLSDEIPRITMSDV